MPVGPTAKMAVPRRCLRSLAEQRCNCYTQDMGRQWLHAKREVAGLKKGQVVGKAYDPADFHSRGGDELIERNDRTGGDADMFDLDTEVGELCPDKLGVGFELILGDVFALACDIEKLRRREYVINFLAPLVDGSRESGPGFV